MQDVVLSRKENDMLRNTGRTFNDGDEDEEEEEKADEVAASDD